MCVCGGGGGYGYLEAGIRSLEAGVIGLTPYLPDRDAGMQTLIKQ